MTTTRKVLNIGFFVIIAGLLINLGRICVSHPKVHAQIRPPFAYTAILKETTIGAPLGSPPNWAITWAVKLDGSRVIKAEMPTPAPRSQRIIDFASGKRVTLDDLHQMKSTTTYNDAMANSWIRDPNSGCLNLSSGQTMSDQVVAGHETVNGYRTVKIARANMAWWYALDYGCAMIKSTVDWGTSKNEQDLVSLLTGEPSATLFTVPASYQEGSPSKLACTFASSDVQGEACNISAETAQRMDEAYWSHHVQE